MRSWIKRNWNYLAVVALFLIVQCCSLIFRVMRSRTFLLVSEQSGPNWNKYQVWMNLDNFLGEFILRTLPLIFLVMVVLMVQKLISPAKVSFMWLLGYGSAALISIPVAAFTEPGYNNYTLELFMGAISALEYIVLGLIVRAVVNKVKKNKPG